MSNTALPPDPQGGPAAVPVVPSASLALPPGLPGSVSPGPGGPTGASGAVQQLPHDIRGLLPYAASAWLLALWVLFGLLALGSAAFGIRAWRRRRRKPPPPVDPWEVLSGRLSALKPVAPFGKAAQEEFFFQLSLLLREAIELRTGVRATDLTWRELHEPLYRKLPLPRSDGDELLALLERADLVKFAESPSDETEARAAAARVGVWLSRLTPLRIGTDAADVAGPGGANAAG